MRANKKPPAYNKGKGKAIAWLRAHNKFKIANKLNWNGKDQDDGRLSSTK